MGVTERAREKRNENAAEQELGESAECHRAKKREIKREKNKNKNKKSGYKKKREKKKKGNRIE